MAAAEKTRMETKDSASATTDAAVLSAGRQWKLLRGPAFGLRVPPLVGLLAVGKVAAEDLADFDNSLCQASGLESRLPASGSAREDLVRCLLDWLVRLQQLARIPLFEEARVISSRTGQSPETLIFRVAAPCFALPAAKLLLSWLIASFNRLAGLPRAERQPANFPGNFADLLKRLSGFKVQGVNAYHFLDAASRLRIPVRQLGDGVFCFGLGAASHWLNSSISHRTSSLGVRFAGNKYRTASLLAAAGIPVPRHVQVGSRDEALQAAERLGYPLVVKPVDQEQGRGVSANIRNEGGLLAAYERAAEFSKKLLVEKHFTGQDYRLTVFNDQVIKVEGRIPAGVTGDGRSTIAELVHQLQQTPRFQKAERDFGKMMVTLDAEACELLGEAGLTPESVLAAGRFQCLRKKNNISAGGTQELVQLADVHPANLSLAVRATQALKLDIAGIDLIIPDIRCSWLEVGAVICEVNAQPQIGKKTTPDIYCKLLAGLMQERYRIPVHLILQASADPLPGAARGEELCRETSANALSTAAGLWIDGELIARDLPDGFAAAKMLLNNAGAETAVCVLPLEEVLDSGLPCDWFESITVYAGESSPHDRQRLAQLDAMLLGHTERVIRK